MTSNKNQEIIDIMNNCVDEIHLTDIILEYKDEMEHKEKMNKVLDELKYKREFYGEYKEDNCIKHKYYDNETDRIMTYEIFYDNGDNNGFDDVVKKIDYTLFITNEIGHKQDDNYNLKEYKTTHIIDYPLLNEDWDLEEHYLYAENFLNYYIHFITNEGGSMFYERINRSILNP